MDRIDELTKLIENSKIRRAELENELYKTMAKARAEEANISFLKKELLKYLLKNEHPFGYFICHATYNYYYDDANWTTQEVKVFDKSTSHEEVGRYFERQADSYLDWNEICDKGKYKIDWNLLFVHELSDMEADDLLEELEPY